MQFDELKTNVANMFPQERGESADHYQFFLKESLDLLRNHNDYAKAWDAVMEYDGNTKRPRFAFFKNVVFTTRSFKADVFTYYKCGCGTLLSDSSNGGCPVCHKETAEMKFSKEAKKVTVCQSSCFDCSIFSNFAIGPTCPDYGTPTFETCKDRGHCKCVACCRFEYQRIYHPDRLRAGHEAAIKALPTPKSAAGKAFQDGRASVKDINGLLKLMGEKMAEKKTEKKTEKKGAA